MLILMLVGVAFASTGFSPRSDEAAKTQQQVPAKGADFKVIQEIPVTGGSMVMPDMQPGRLRVGRPARLRGL